LPESLTHSVYGITEGIASEQIDVNSYIALFLQLMMLDMIVEEKKRYINTGFD